MATEWILILIGAGTVSAVLALVGIALQWRDTEIIDKLRPDELESLKTQMLIHGQKLCENCGRRWTREELCEMCIRVRDLTAQLVPAPIEARIAPQSRTYTDSRTRSNWGYQPLHNSEVWGDLFKHEEDEL